VSLPRSTSLTKCASTCIWTCMGADRSAWSGDNGTAPGQRGPHEWGMGSVPSQAPRATLHTEYSKTIVRPGPDHRREARRSRPGDSRPTLRRTACCRWSNW
jgi:hypothetical protein